MKTSNGLQYKTNLSILRSTHILTILRLICDSKRFRDYYVIQSVLKPFKYIPKRIYILMRFKNL